MERYNPGLQFASRYRDEDISSGRNSVGGRGGSRDDVNGVDNELSVIMSKNLDPAMNFIYGLTDNIDRIRAATADGDGLVAKKMYDDLVEGANAHADKIREWTMYNGERDDGDMGVIASRLVTNANILNSRAFSSWTAGPDNRTLGTLYGSNDPLPPNLLNSLSSLDPTGQIKGKMAAAASSGDNATYDFFSNLVAPVVQARKVARTTGDTSLLERPGVEGRIGLARRLLSTWDKDAEKLGGTDNLLSLYSQVLPQFLGSGKPGAEQAVKTIKDIVVKGAEGSPDGVTSLAIDNAVKDWFDLGAKVASLGGPTKDLTALQCSYFKTVSDLDRDVSDRLMADSDSAQTIAAVSSKLKALDNLYGVDTASMFGKELPNAMFLGLLDPSSSRDPNNLAYRLDVLGERVYSTVAPVVAQNGGTDLFATMVGNCGDGLVRVLANIAVNGFTSTDGQKKTIANTDEDALVRNALDDTEFFDRGVAALYRAMPAIGAPISEKDNRASGTYGLADYLMYRYRAQLRNNQPFDISRELDMIDSSVRPSETIHSADGTTRSRVPSDPLSGPEQQFIGIYRSLYDSFRNQGLADQDAEAVTLSKIAGLKTAVADMKLLFNGYNSDIEQKASQYESLVSSGGLGPELIPYARNLGTMFRYKAADMVRNGQSPQPLFDEAMSMHTESGLVFDPYIADENFDEKLRGHRIYGKLDAYNNPTYYMDDGNGRPSRIELDAPQMELLNDKWHMKSWLVPGRVSIGSMRDAAAQFIDIANSARMEAEASKNKTGKTKSGASKTAAEKEAADAEY